MPDALLWWMHMVLQAAMGIVHARGLHSTTEAGFCAIMLQNRHLARRWGTCRLRLRPRSGRAAVPPPSRFPLPECFLAPRAAAASESLMLVVLLNPHSAAAPPASAAAASERRWLGSQMRVSRATRRLQSAQRGRCAGRLRQASRAPPAYLHSSLR